MHAEHIIQELKAIWDYYALRRGMRDVALVPESDVFHSGKGEAPQDPRQADDALTHNGITLMRHGRAALLPGSKGFFYFARFGLLQSAYFRCELLERTADYG